MSTRPAITPRSTQGCSVLPSAIRSHKPAHAQPHTRYVARRARAADADAVHELIAHYAAQGLLLPRTEADVHTNIDHFLVLSHGGCVVGCVALEPYGAELAEIRSLAVAAAHAGGGRGARLVRFALAVARRRRIARVFAVTHAPEFFERLGFARVERQSIQEKVKRDCLTCPKQKACRLIALSFAVQPGSMALPILDAAAATA